MRAIYKTLIFDVDGTLINTEEAVLGSLQKMLQLEYNKNYAREDLSFVLGIPGSRSLPQLGIEDIDRANELWNRYMRDFMDTIHVYHGVEEILHTLASRGVQLGIVTSKTKEELKDDFEPFGLMKYLSVVVCADDTEHHKPHPEPIYKFLEVSGADPSSAIYIGDTVYDSSCARDSKIAFGLAMWGANPEHNIEADHYFHNPEEINMYAKP
ncbi:HAD family hydrolase [Paenibacillus motobuensis]|uniref:HAD family hydrolase n=1 Tax=Paenibacillus TaxID=44249 RepID=UPI00203C03D3|nr:HAD family hydrolase [Paenibacillus lutimineralis]MCM3646466.1 HAD family hydrolase [Paenibacillus motobuensis]